MIKALETVKNKFILIGSFAFLLFTVYFKGKSEGKENERVKNVKSSVNDAIETKKRRAGRLNDSNDAVYERMRKRIEGKRP